MKFCCVIIVDFEGMFTMKQMIISFMMLFLLCSCSSRFDQESWLHEPEKREDMVSSLTSQYTLEGMTENEIIDLLGEPAEKLTEQSREFLYFMGYTGVSVVLFQIQINQSGIVESYDVIFK